ncbi:hypothetical protein E4U31_004048 [Claviceps sp. LM219 group G6]|nr:hypothetical protein E4U31_004048 [Claviceps sp. LM219 group G6]
MARYKSDMEVNVTTRETVPDAQSVSSKLENKNMDRGFGEGIRTKAYERWMPVPSASASTGRDSEGDTVMMGVASAGFVGRGRRRPANGTGIRRRAERSSNARFWAAAPLEAATA